MCAVRSRPGAPGWRDSPSRPDLACGPASTAPGPIDDPLRRGSRTRPAWSHIVSANDFSRECARMLNQVADGVWVRQSEWVWSNAIVVRGDDGLILVDPGIDGADLDQLADDVEALGIPVVAGFSTHCHWDHLLWHSRFGDVPRYATDENARAAREARERAQAMAAESASAEPRNARICRPDRAVRWSLRSGCPVRGRRGPRARGRCRGPPGRGPACRGSCVHRRAAAWSGTGRRPSGSRLALRPPPVEPGAGPTLTRMNRPDLVDVLEMPPGKGAVSTVG